MSDSTTKSNQSSQQTSPTPERSKGPRIPILSEAWGFVRFVFSGFGLFDAVLRKRRGANRLEEVIVHQFHTGIYLWLWILFGFVSSCLVSWGADASLFGWLYLMVVMYTLITVLFDISRNMMLVVLLAIGFVGVSGLYLQDHVNLPVISSLYSFFVGMQVRLDPGFARALSWLLLIPFGCVLVQAYFDGHVRITSNEIEVYHYGKMTDSISRIGKRIRERYRDLNETLLGLGAADMVVIDYNGKEERLFQNIVGLRYRWAEIDRMLEVWDVEVQNNASRKEAEVASRPDPSQA